MAVNSCEECQNVHSVVVLNDEGPTDQQYEPSSNINYSEVPKVMQSQLFLNSKPGLHNHTNLEVDDVNDYAPCVLDVDIEKGMAESLKSNVETVATLTSDDSLQKALHRDICLHIGGKFMQLLMNHGIELPKFTSRERVYDAASSRSRKYKRSQSFNSRRILLLFSVMSSMGTIILIYLTLRVRLVSDGSGNV
ncbi:uncharacterized protein LOC131021829 isoform X2 [Salvia miltiorrhiza]|uniref:uncharacterized protein LOC131021829 isoform X2 n=1 Tax=Salvia miltiorrhiza TaxID=226208 RepID=UPI0025ABDA7F|nr:uncharacterized protein LOC131021829 isoform X2 [Salvia miltiorrhiza]